MRYIFLRQGTVRARGSTLLEVTLALAILATCGLALAAQQLWLARAAQSSALRVRAALAADALAEAALGANDALAGQWQTRLPALVPGSMATTTSLSADLFAVAVTWPARPSLPRTSSASTAPPASGAQQLCTGAASMAASRDCVWLIYIR